MSYRLYSPSRPRSLFSEGWGLGSLREVFFLIGERGDILWSDASDSPVRLPDSRARWEAIWSRRDRIVAADQRCERRIVEEAPELSVEELRL